MNYEDFQGLILEQFNRVFNELADIKSKVGGLEKRFDGLEGKVEELKSRFDGLEEKVGGLDAKVSRNTLLLERTDKNVMLLQEGLVGLRQHVDKKFDEIETGLNGKLNVLELVIRNHSAAVDELEGEVDELHIKSRHMQGTLGVHEVEIKLLKDKISGK